MYKFLFSLGLFFMLGFTYPNPIDFPLSKGQQNPNSFQEVLNGYKDKAIQLNFRAPNFSLSGTLVYVGNDYIQVEYPERTSYYQFSSIVGIHVLPKKPGISIDIR